MAQESSLADNLVRFMRARDEAKEAIDALPDDGDVWPQLGLLLEQQEKAIRDALSLATITAHRLGRLAKQVAPKQPADSD